MLPRIRRRWSPKRLADLVGWYDASQVTGLAEDGAVGTWPDLSGLNHHLLQATAGNKPTYKTNIQNGLPVIRFDGAADPNHDWMAAAFTLIQPVTVYGVVIRREAIATTTALWDGVTASNTMVCYVADADADVRLFVSAVLLSGQLLAQDTAAAVVAVCSTTASFVGVNDTGTTGTTGAAKSIGGLTIATFGDTHPAANAFQADFGEVVVVNHASSAAEQSLVVNYFRRKWQTP